MKKQLLLLLIILMPMVASADESGICGDNLTWTYVEATNTLTISGTGEMWGYYGTGIPIQNRESVENLVIEEGVTTIGKLAFSGFHNLKAISIPHSITKIDDYAFLSCQSIGSLILSSNLVEIGVGAFRECSSLSNLRLQEGSDDYLYIAGDAFLNCPIKSGSSQE